MLTLKQILKVMEHRALYEGPNVAVPRDHCSHEYSQERECKSIEQQMKNDKYEENRNFYL